jgi:hypothetical protein
LSALRSSEPQKRKNPCETREKPGIAGVKAREAPVGVEPTMADLQSDREPRKPRVKQGLSESMYTPMYTSLPADPDLSAVVDAWDSLPPAVRAGILAMVRASRPVRGADD